MDVAGEKSRLRRDVLSRLKAILPRLREEASAALRARLSPILSQLEQERERPLSVALYVPLPHEVNLMPMLKEYPQHRYAFPRCCPGRQLSFHFVEEPAHELHPAAMGIPAPGEELPSLAPADIDLLVVPGVAFSETGLRLGYGGGYYDRFIPRCTQARVLALAFAEQMAGFIPCDEHDVCLPQVIHVATRGH